MKDFFKFMFASMLGFIIILVVVFFIFVGLDRLTGFLC